jgi:hypothetical protein
VPLPLERGFQRIDVAVRCAVTLRHCAISRLLIGL